MIVSERRLPRKSSSLFVPVKRHFDLLWKHALSIPALPRYTDHWNNDPSLKQALQGLETVIGISVQDSTELLEYIPEDKFDIVHRDLLSWKDVGRGKDVFVRGCGSFDIVTTYEKLVRRNIKKIRRDVQLECQNILKPTRPRVDEELLNDLANSDDLDLFKFMKKGAFDDFIPAFVQPMECWQRVCSGSNSLRYFRHGFHPFWLVNLVDLQAHAYFGSRPSGVWGVDEPAQILLRQDESCPQRQNLIRYKDFWSQPDHISLIEELALPVKEEEAHYWPVDGHAMPPGQLLDAMRDTKMKYLDDLPDKGPIQVLRTSQQIRKVGHSLQNCAAKYIRAVAREHCVLIALNDENGKPVALGKFELLDCYDYQQVYFPDMADNLFWEAIPDARDQPPPDFVADAFDKYLHTLLLDWHLVRCGF